MNIELNYYEIIEAVEDYLNRNYPCKFNLNEQIDHGFNSVNISDKHYSFNEGDAIHFSLVCPNEITKSD